ncbi:MAG: DUF4416 family protein [Candidatus Tectomicrobia bacterium]|nr:DUF4416 family protein [Candidatus Tectomicrobia bacterium]
MGKITMGQVKTPPPVKLVIGFIFATEEILKEVCLILSQRFGEIDHESEILPFTITDYYREEMGGNLKRKFVSYRTLIEVGSLSEIKLLTNSIEMQVAIEEEGKKKRRVNIDPGYLEASKFVLATTKNYQHRLYIGQGIYGEVTLRFRNKTFESWEWTYPDYKTAESIHFFNDVRKIYMEQLRRSPS